MFPNSANIPFDVTTYVCLRSQCVPKRDERARITRDVWVFGPFRVDSVEIMIRLIGKVCSFGCGGVGCFCRLSGWEKFGFWWRDF